jgi:ABC-2 type transport system ATP-binding protein
MESRQPEALKAELERRYGTEARIEDHVVRMEVADGGKFLPQLLKELETPLEGVELRKPTLEDVFLHQTGRAIRAEEGSTKDAMRTFVRSRGGGRRG